MASKPTNSSKVQSRAEPRSRSTRNRFSSWMDDGRSQAPIRRSMKVSEDVALRIVENIVSQGLDTMAMLPSETEMLEQYRVSRGSLREALRILEVNGLVVIRPGPGGGPMVAAANPLHFAHMSALYYHFMEATLRELLEARMLMEPIFARAAAERQDPRFMEQLSEFLVQGMPDASDDVTYLRAASDFHGLLVAMSGNPILDIIGLSLKELYMQRITAIHAFEADRPRTLQDHREIAEAILSGDGDRAEKVARQHLIDFGEMAETNFPGLLDEVVSWY